ncbi:MAG: phenylalanine--tRNA ligase subunit beta, partial [Candidatus Levybacteria bacterium]|nr:phenylalanine--tRNA ligase subunit beta [Candidatus Levybacteria bacterium]
MNIKILDSWLREHLKTKATAHEIARQMSLSSISIERVDKLGSDFVYDIEITTNRPDLASVIGLAREAAAILPQQGIWAEFIPQKIEKPVIHKKDVPLSVLVDEKVTNRICAAILDVKVEKSPDFIKKRLEASDIRSLNNVIDITNYCMRLTGHPVHVFDYDRISTHIIRLRQSKNGELITTLDGKTYPLPGGDIIADDGEGNIVDLISIMGLENSVVTDETKRIILFIDNVDRHKLRKTSMTLNIRTEAVQLNEKGVDPEIAMDTLLTGISLYEKHAKGQVIAPIIDIYPSPRAVKKVSVALEKIQTIMGIPIEMEKAEQILKSLDFKVSVQKNIITAQVPFSRFDDIDIPEDLVEEVARIYGYHNLPSILPPIFAGEVVQAENIFFWEDRIKKALKYWGGTEVYTYPMVSESMYEGPIEDAVKLANPLGEEFVYMRKTLIPSLLKVIEDNKKRDKISIFEIANVYDRRDGDLPIERRVLAGVIKDHSLSFFHVKGMLEQLFADLGIKKMSLRSRSNAGLETSIIVDKQVVGDIEVLDDGLYNFEIDEAKLLLHASTKKTYTPSSKFPPIVEDISAIIADEIPTEDIMTTISQVDQLVYEVTLKDKYKDTRTFHIVYKSFTENLTDKTITPIRERIIDALIKTHHATIK